MPVFVAGWYVGAVGLGTIELEIERELNERRLLSAITAWYEAVDGKIPLTEALSELCNSFGADAAGVSRYGHRSVERPRLVFYDRRPHDAFVPQVSRAYTHCVLGEFARRARSGTVWQSSAVSDLDPALTTFQTRRALRELIVCTLGSGDDGYDYLELHFDREVTGELLARIETAAVSLHRGWQNRTPGRFFERIVESRPASGAGDIVNLLTFENPARLSRAEYRVCHLLSQGLSNNAVISELKITQATLKTHLRNIYIKAGVENKCELIYRLLTVEKAANSRLRSTG